MSSIKSCQACGGIKFKVILTQGAIVETVPKEIDPKGYKVLEAGANITIGKFMECMTCQAKDPVVVEKELAVACPSCHNMVAQTELNNNNGVCLVCQAKSQSPQLNSLTQDQLIRLLLESQMKAQLQPFAGPTPSASQNHTEAIHEATAPVIAETPVFSAPVNTTLSSAVETPAYTASDFQVYMGELNLLMGTFDPQWSGQKRGGLTRKLNSLLESVKPVYESMLSQSINVENPEDVVARFWANIAATSTLDAAADTMPTESVLEDVLPEETIDPFTTAESDEMVVQSVYGDDSIVPIITPVILQGGTDMPVSAPMGTAPVFSPVATGFIPDTVVPQQIPPNPPSFGVDDEEDAPY